MPDVVVGLATIPLKARYEPRDEPLDAFFIPALKESNRYDRAVGYWSSSEVAFAAKGLAYFISGLGMMRLIVGAELSEADIEALTTGDAIDDVVARRILEDPALSGAQEVASRPHQVLAWLVKEGRLDIRVAVPVKNGRYMTKEESGKFFHTKIGVLSDAFGNSIAFEGSNNATAAAWNDNYETFNVFESWDDPAWRKYGQPLTEQFEDLWANRRDPEWCAISLPEAVRQRLISIAPDVPPVPNWKQTTVVDPVALEQLRALQRAPREKKWTAVGTAPVMPLPHQANIIKRVIDTFPRSYLFADTVGMGKTIEIGLVLRELLLSGKVEKVLLLVPASVQRQWQEELLDKIGLQVPRLVDGYFLDFEDKRVAANRASNPWNAQTLVLASSHLARRRDRREHILEAGPWDLVVVDEAHHARRKGSNSNEAPNTLLLLLQTMKSHKMWKGLYLATATPMQMNPHEVWDLLELLDLPGSWGISAERFTSFYKELREPAERRDWQMISTMLRDYFSDELAERDTALETRIKDLLGLVGSQKILKLAENPPAPGLVKQWNDQDQECADSWLRRHTPMRDRAFRNTRETLLKYQAAGLISPDMIIPVRQVNDVFIPLNDEERRLYFKIDDYISKFYDAYKATASTQALGFIMTVYRRRLTSSFAAIRASMKRRLDALEGRKRLVDLLDSDDQPDVEDSPFDPEDLEVSTTLLAAEIDELRVFVRELENLTGADTKAQMLIADVNDALAEYHSVVVFTQYTDTMNYIRDQFVQGGYTKIACYSGKGGEIYNPLARLWAPMSKTEVKEKFRLGEITVLLGTDSMSEGLNLQSCGRVFQVEMPWNFARSEQRNGRCDRIGAKYRTIKVTNYFYADTVEQRVYSGIRSDFVDFTEIIGAAQPVLGDIERTIERLALMNRDLRDLAIGKAIEQLKHDIADLAERPVQVFDLGNDEIEDVPELTSEIDLKRIEAILMTNPLTREEIRINSDKTLSIAQWSTDGSKVFQGSFTFDREVHELGKAELLTFGNKAFDRFLSSTITVAES